MKKSHKLSLKEEFPFFLIGISSHENDYRVSWAINNQLGISFIRSANLEIHHPRREHVQEFPLYQFFDDETLLQYNLISNRCDDGFLLEEITNIDFILQIYGETNDSFINKLTGKLRNIDMITTAFRIDPENLKSKEKLLF